MNRVEHGTWRDVQAASQHELLERAKEFGLDGLQLRVMASHRRQPQATEGKRWLLINLLLPTLKGTALTYNHLSVLIGAHETITMHTGELPTDIREAIEHHTKLDKHPTGVLAVIMNVAVERYSPILDKIDDVIDKLEDNMIDRPDQQQLHQLFLYKKLLVELRRIVLPMTGMLNALSDGRYSLIAERYVPYLRDSYDASWRTHEIIDTMRDLLTSALDTYLSVVSNHLNDVMRRLTIVATIFMPLSFITGFGGMNFLQMPFKSDSAFALMLLAIIATPVSMLVYFKRKKWM